MNVTTLGNTELLKLPKTAFLCSRKAPASSVLKCYDWATAMRDTHQCVVSGFHSPLEKDVLYFLMKRKQSVILVLGRTRYIVDIAARRIYNVEATSSNFLFQALALLKIV